MLVLLLPDRKIEKGTRSHLQMAFGTFLIPDFSGAFYQNSLLVQAQGQLVLTAYIVS
jgi:hypothetical protein